MKRRMAALVLLPTLFVACGDDDDVADTLSPAVTMSTEVITEGITVVATDYRYDGLPATAPAGTQFTLQNDSTTRSTKWWCSASPTPRRVRSVRC